MKKTLSKKTVSKALSEEYGGLIGGIAELLEASRRVASRTVNALMTATYWEIGRRIVEFEQRGKKRAEYGEELLQRLAQDLTARFGRGFSYPNVNKFRQFYLAFPSPRILSTPSNRIHPANCLDSVNRITTQERPDIVWRIASSRSCGSVSAALVALCPPAFHEERRSAPIL